MDAKVTSILSYCTWIGWLIAFFAGDKEGAKFHLNQGLVVMLFSLAAIIPIIGWIWEIFIVVCMVLGIISAAKGEEKEVPLLGKIQILK